VHHDETPAEASLSRLDVPPAELIVADGRRHTAQSILDAWRADKSPNTMRSYEHDLSAFARFLSSGFGITPPLTIEAALDRLFREDSANAHGIALQFRTSMLAANLAPASINRALATLRDVSKLARMLGVVYGGWYLEVPGAKAERRRDTRGPVIDDICAPSKKDRHEGFEVRCYSEGCRNC
jgi:hypothetical protein